MEQVEHPPPALNLFHCRLLNPGTAILPPGRCFPVTEIQPEKVHWWFEAAVMEGRAQLREPLLDSGVGALRILQVHLDRQPIFQFRLGPLLERLAEGDLEVWMDWVEPFLAPQQQGWVVARWLETADPPGLRAFLASLRAHGSAELGLDQVYEPRRKAWYRPENFWIGLSYEGGAEESWEHPWPPDSPGLKGSDLVGLRTYQGVDLLDHFEIESGTERECEQTETADLLERARARLAQDPVGAFELLSKVAEQGLTEAHYLLGQLYRQGHGTSIHMGEAYRHFLLAAEAGHGAAQQEVGLAYLEGQAGFSRRKLPEAIEWLRKAAEQGYLEAHFELGSLNRRGEGMPRDLEQAIEHFTVAAEEGHIWAMHYLAQVLEERGDREKAIHWFTRAGEAGLEHAQFELAELLLESDPKQGIFWLEKASFNGDYRATELLGEMQRRGHYPGTTGQEVN